MRRIVLLALGALLIGPFAKPLTARAAEPPPRASDPESQLDLPLEGQVTSANWRSIPSGDDMAKEYPRLAQLMNLTGKAMIRCATDTEGRLQDCKVIEESPAGFGFGAAAVRLSAYFSMTPARIDGQPVNGVVAIPINFAMDGQTNVAAEPEPPAPTSPAALELARKVLALEGVAGRLKEQSRPAAARLVSEAVLNGDIKSSTVALDAFQQGMDDVIQAALERHARMMASKMTETQLRATINFLESPPGSAWVAAGVDVTMSEDSIRALGAAARRRLCESLTCDANGQPKG